MIRVLIAAGGTGGHIYPGIAVANEIMRRDAGSEVHFVGTARGLETKIVPEHGFQLSVIRSVGLKNVGFMGKVRGIAVLPQSFVEAWKLIRDLRPHCVVGAGGYVSGPVLMTAALMGRRTLVMDSNALPGFTNRQLARFVDKAALTFEEALPYFGKKGVVTGNPVRKEFFDIEPRKQGTPARVLVFGGSQGSRAINNAVIDALPHFKKASIEIVHQTGEGEFEAVEAAYRASTWDAFELRPYISDMVSAFDAADLVICRSGATTCAELCAAGKPAIMIPLPTAADDHQRKNAEALVRTGGAVMILQAEASGERLAAEVGKLFSDADSISKMGAALRSLARPDAAEATVDLIEALARK